MNTIELNILLPALIAGLLVLGTHIPLGMKILERGVIFADLAVAQIAGLGIVIAALLDLAVGHTRPAKIIEKFDSLVGHPFTLVVQGNHVVAIV